MIRKCLNGIFLALIVAASVGILAVFAPALWKIRPQIVLSGSMEPEISVGSLVYIAEGIPVENIKPGDVIAYRLGESMNILHRVIQVEEKTQSFLTKGDANRQADLGRVEFSQYRGKEVFCIPYLGYVAKFLQTGHHMIWILCGIAGLVAVDEIWKKREGGKAICRKKNGKIHG